MFLNILKWLLSSARHSEAELWQFGSALVLKEALFENRSPIRQILNWRSEILGQQFFHKMASYELLAGCPR